MPLAIAHVNPAHFDHDVRAGFADSNDKLNASGRQTLQPAGAGEGAPPVKRLTECRNDARVLTSREKLHRCTREAPIDGHQIDPSRCSEQRLLAIGTAIGIVVVAVRPELDANGRTRFGRARRHIGRDERAEDGARNRYSSQPH
jgi:hypothetical protein